MTVLDRCPRTGDGPFDEMVELAKERAGATGDSVVLHRPFDIDHEDDPSCICRPLIIKSDSIEDPEGLYTELNRADG